LITVIKGIIAESRLLQVATADWEQLLKQPGDQLPNLLNARLMEFSRQRRFSDLLPISHKLLALEPKSPENFYNAACGLCLATNAITNNDQPLTPSQQAERQKLIDSAIEALKAAVAAGWENFDHMAKDSDLTVLRKHPDFEALLKTKPQ
jgi:hypothetical protein